MAGNARTSDGGSQFPPMPPATKGVLIAYVTASVLNMLLGPWLGGFRLMDWVSVGTEDLLGGEVWRLFTWPFVATQAFEFIFSGLMLWWFLGEVELEWGTRRLLRRLPFMAALPALVTGLVGLAVPGLYGAGFVGPGALVVMVVLAFASANPYRQIRFFMAPAPLSGDQLIVLEGILLAIFILFDATILGHFLELAAFGVALAWFRFEWDRFVNLNPRKTLLKWKKKRLQAKLAKLEKKGTLRVVRDDGDDKPKYLN